MTPTTPTETQALLAAGLVAGGGYALATHDEGSTTSTAAGSTAGALGPGAGGQAPGATGTTGSGTTT